MVKRVNKEKRKTGIDKGKYYILGGGNEGKQSKKEARNRIKQVHYIRGSYKGKQRREEAKNRYKQVPYIGGGYEGKQDQTLLWTCVTGAYRQCVNSRYAKFK